MSTLRKRKFTWLNALTVLIILAFCLAWLFLIGGQFMIHVYPFLHQ
ncbi:hypothetical protein [Spirosoma sordidisoli]|nr:hypothetical protein [Spirosoma sordidisoli]